MGNRIRTWSLILVGCVLLLGVLAGCGTQEVDGRGLYGYREVMLPSDYHPYPPTTLAQILSETMIDTVLVVSTDILLEERPVREFRGETLPEEPLDSGVYYPLEFMTTMECTVLEVVETHPDRALAPGDRIVLAQRSYLREERRDGQVETVLIRPDPYDYPMETGQPYLVICTSMPAFGETGVFYFPQPFCTIDLTSRELTPLEMAALTSDPEAPRLLEYQNALQRLTQRKAAVAEHPELSRFYTQYAGVTYTAANPDGSA
ncbi:MAG: hypothetical protein GX153_02535 [Clostridiaceae bacterium]|nr:hypothetical protein [Clostridiaceae bacterium]